ncbi:MAG: hypothetical protein ACTSYC_10225, partial [Promethearchaeota archaeon]
MTYHPHHARFYKKGRALYLKMLVVEENPLIMNFFEEHEMLVVDEHVIPKMGKEIEGIDYFYSMT